MKLTLRVRLTLIYTGLFAMCGAAIVIIAYLMVPSLQSDGSRVSQQQVDFLDLCTRSLATLSSETQFKCQRAYEEGLMAGAASQREATLEQMVRYSVITFVVVTLFAAIAGWILAGRALRPVHQLIAAARNASQHDLSARVASTGPRDELRELADTFDDMLARLEAAFQSQRQFIANASHELRTPLTVMRTAVDVVLAKPEPAVAELRGMGNEVRAAVTDAEKLIDSMLTLARNEHGLSRTEPVDLATAAENALDDLDTGDRAVLPSLQPAIVDGDAILLERLIANLVDNAVRYNDSRGQVWVSVQSAAPFVRLTVANTGPVIAPESTAALLEPFRRLNNRTARDGFGLGLAIVSSIAAVHHGTVSLHPRPDGGLSVDVLLPQHRGS
ncbi:sensor protein CutS [Rhizocola hellebori]|uniref:histidine kinase n=1 Tax=Rhizocola hellebori TaxID=1392758 RepID=A0A8J3VF42_9ACTN|nr:HAMP domain-containing sensor histidine kinase [Rhizocola hellebori]GIH03568.1 sensor protein CutS [Rhizocola hellebori]